LRPRLIHGAQSCLLHLERSRYRLGRWIDGLQRRMPNNKVTMPLAVKMARVG
jgi:transposase